MLLDKTEPEDRLNSRGHDQEILTDTVWIPGVEGEHPKRSQEGDEYVYFCGYCSTPPPVKPGQVAMEITHSVCVDLRAKEFERKWGFSI